MFGIASSLCSSQRRTLRNNFPLFRGNRLSALIAATFIVLFFCAGARAAQQILPVDKLKPGMTGYGRTVFAGLKVEKFPVVVRGILPGAGLSGESLILIEMTGPELDKYGGVSMGMSGSPIYINNKLIGALALTFERTDHRLGGVTPIESMMKIKMNDTARTGLIPLKSPFIYAGKSYRSIRYGRVQNDAPAAGEDTLVARFALAPVAIRGISARTYPYIRKFFEDNGVEMRPVDGLSAGSSMPASEIGPGSALVPGSSVSVQLVRGDIDISAAGTLTMINGKDVLMFGHPFFRKGPVKYLLADAYIHAIVKSSDMPYKIASTGVARGEVVQDRGSALLGHLNVFPKLIPLKITVTDLDINKVKSYNFKVVQDPDILINLIVMALLQSIDNTIDRVGNGTSYMSFTLLCESCNGSFKRENMFYDRNDISARSLTELIAALSIVQDNVFKDTPVSGLELAVQIDSTNSFASIESAELAPKDEPAAGAESKPAAPSGENDDPADDSGDGTIENDSAPGIEVPDGGSLDNSKDPDASGVGSGFDIDLGGHDPKPVVEKKLKGNTSNQAPEPKAAPYANKEKDNKPAPTVRPGEKIGIKVQLRPYRSKLVEETIYLKVPRDISPGNAIISVFSGMKQQETVAPGDFLMQINGKEKPHAREQEQDAADAEKEKDKSFDELLKKFSKRDLNNELVATISSLNFNLRDEEDPVEKEKENTEKESAKRSKKRTQWALEGSASIKVRVSNSAAPAADPTEFKKRGIKKSKITSLRDKK